MRFILAGAIAWEDKVVIYPKDDKLMIEKLKVVAANIPDEDQKAILQEGE
jgi:hypothetical protein